jgi:putative SOS response-associated peptidase YedK
MTRLVGRKLGVEFSETPQADGWNVAPTDPVAAIVSPAGTPEPRMLRWSFLPPWANEQRLRRPLFNARVEGLRDRQQYAGVPIDAEHRALVLADGFYEWLHPRSESLRPQPHRFTVDGGTAFAFAAVWTRNGRIGEHPVESCSIITCPSAENPLVAKIHDRIPAILTEAEELRAWLSDDVAIPHALSLCRALPAERMGVEAREPGRRDEKQQ